MLPNEPVSHNIGPPWKPQVWTDGPDELVRQAQSQLFQDRAHMENGVLSAPQNAMAGQATSVANEAEQLINPTASGSSRSADWQNILGELRATEPVVWADKPVEHQINPAP